MATPVSPLSLFSQGKLTEALVASAAAVSLDPVNVAMRWVHCELLCFKGDYDRADKHLDMIATQDPTAGSRAWAFRQVLRAAEARQQFYDAGRVPEFLVNPNAELQFRVKATIHLRENDLPAAQEACAEASKNHVACPGSAGAEKFADFFDTDDRLGGAIEALSVMGKYYLLPIAGLESLEFSPLQRALDQLWRPGKFKVRDGEEGEALFPVLYPGSEKSADDTVRLGRITTWQGGIGGVPARGLGRKDFQMGQNPISILELTRVVFDAPP